MDRLNRCSTPLDIHFHINSTEKIDFGQDGRNETRSCHIDINTHKTSGAYAQEKDLDHIASIVRPIWAGDCNILLNFPVWLWLRVPCES